MTVSPSSNTEVKVELTAPDPLVLRQRYVQVLGCCLGLPIHIHLCESLGYHQTCGIGSFDAVVNCIVVIKY